MLRRIHIISLITIIAVMFAGNAFAVTTIHVAAGTYTEQLLIQKPLILVGAGINQTIVKIPTSGRATFAGITGVGTNWISDYVLAAYPTDWNGAAATGSPISVKITGMTFDADNQTHTTGADRFTGVFFGCVKGANIGDAGLFASEVKGFLVTYNSATGIRVLGDSKLTIDSNNPVGYTINGIAVYGDLSSSPDPVVAISNNTVNYLQSATTGYDEQIIMIAFGAQAVVNGNTATNGVNGIILSYANDCTISNNNLSNVSAGVGGSNGMDMGWTIVMDNTSSNNTASGNTLTNCELGFWVSNGSNNNRITNNTVTGNRIAAQVDVYSGGAEPTGLQFDLNKFTGSVINEFVNNTSVQTNAQKNWWGTVIGTEIAAKIFGTVDYSNFAETSALNRFYAPTNSGQSVVTATLKVITLTGSDADHDVLTFSIVDGPSYGSLGTITGTARVGTSDDFTATVAYTPTAGYSGTDSFTYQVDDGILNSSAATINITVRVRPTDIYVDATWTDKLIGEIIPIVGDRPAVEFGYDAFLTIQEAIDAAQ